MLTESELIEHYHVLLLGALKRCHIKCHHPEFDDYLQIARLILLETYREFSTTNQDMSGFHNFVYQKIYWQLTDTLRKEARRTTTQDVIDPYVMDYTDLPTTIIDEEAIAVSELISALSPDLTKHERRYLIETYINDLTVKQLAEKYQVNRTAVYKWRRGVAKKYLNYLAK